MAKNGDHAGGISVESFALSQVDAGRRSAAGGRFVRLVAMLLLLASSNGTVFAAQLSVGQKAPDFSLATPTGIPVQLSKQTEEATVVLVVLRGYPGYQCPYCQKQVHDFIEHASEFAARHAKVLLIYPGPPADLDQHAREFLAKQANLPVNVVLVTDPDYSMTNRYDLRWNAPAETAYPSTFIIDRKGIVTFAKISHSHGDRTTATDILAVLPAR